jgi:hypothetical protein
MLQYLDYISSYFIAVSLIWFLFITGIKFIPRFLKLTNESTEKMQVRGLLLSIPFSIIIGYIMFNFLGFNSYLKVV